MALPFSQSLRSLHADRGRTALAGFATAAVLLALWSVWFFTASITQTESGVIIGTTRDDRVLAEFSPQAATAIQPGQAAYIHPAGEDSALIGPIAGVVAAILGPTANNQVEVSLYARWDAASAPLLDGDLAGQAVVEVEHISPAKAVVRSSGQLVDTPPLTFSPQ